MAIVKTAPLQATIHGQGAVELGKCLRRLVMRAQEADRTLQQRLQGLRQQRHRIDASCVALRERDRPPLKGRTGDTGHLLEVTSLTAQERQLRSLGVKVRRRFAVGAVARCEAANSGALRRREVCIIGNVAPPAANAIQRGQSINEPRFLASTSTYAPLLRLRAAHPRGVVQMSPTPGPEWHEKRLRWRPTRLT